MEAQSGEWRSFLTDMIDCAEKVNRYTSGMDQDQFVKDALTYDATMWNIRIIGEAAMQIPDEIQDANSHIEWRQMIGMRHRITHAYEAIDTDIDWDTIKIDIPKLLSDLRELSKRLDES